MSLNPTPENVDPHHGQYHSSIGVYPRVSRSLRTLVSKFETLDTLNDRFQIPELQPGPLKTSRNSSTRNSSRRRAGSPLLPGRSRLPIIPSNGSRLVETRDCSDGVLFYSALEDPFQSPKSIASASRNSSMSEFRCTGRTLIQNKAGTLRLKSEAEVSVLPSPRRTTAPEYSGSLLKIPDTGTRNQNGRSISEKIKFFDGCTEHISPQGHEKLKTSPATTLSKSEVYSKNPSSTSLSKLPGIFLCSPTASLRRSASQNKSVPLTPRPRINAHNHALDFPVSSPPRSGLSASTKTALSIPRSSGIGPPILMIPKQPKSSASCKPSVSMTCSRISETSDTDVGRSALRPTDGAEDSNGEPSPPSSEIKKPFRNPFLRETARIKLGRHDTFLTRSMSPHQQEPTRWRANVAEGSPSLRDRRLLRGSISPAKMNANANNLSGKNLATLAERENLIERVESLDQGEEEEPPKEGVHTNGPKIPERKQSVQVTSRHNLETSPAMPKTIHEPESPESDSIRTTLMAAASTSSDIPKQMQTHGEETLQKISEEASGRPCTPQERQNKKTLARIPDRPQSFNVSLPGSAQLRETVTGTLPQSSYPRSPLELAAQVQPRAPKTAEKQNIITHMTRPPPKALLTTFGLTSAKKNSIKDRIQMFENIAKREEMKAEKVGPEAAVHKAPVNSRSSISQKTNLFEKKGLNGTEAQEVIEALTISGGAKEDTKGPKDAGRNGRLDGSCSENQTPMKPAHEESHDDGFKVIKAARCDIREPKPLRLSEMKRMMLLCRGKGTVLVVERERIIRKY